MIPIEMSALCFATVRPAALCKAKERAMTQLSDLLRLNRREAIQAALGAAAVSPLALNASAAEKLPAGAAAAPSPVVEVATGKVRGYTNRGVAIFRGIPYGASTTGANRFLPPKKPEPWPGVRNCLSYGHSCPQAGTGVIE